MKKDADDKDWEWFEIGLFVGFVVVLVWFVVSGVLL